MEKSLWQDFIDDFATYFLDKIPDRSTLIKSVKRIPFWLKDKIFVELLSRPDIKAQGH